MKRQIGVALNENFTITPSFRELRQTAKKNGVPLHKYRGLFAPYKLSPGDVFGLSDLWVEVDSVFGRIKEFKVFRNAASYRCDRVNVYESFDEINERLIEIYGAPHYTSGSHDNDNTLCEWYFAGIKIRHYIFERFGAGDYLVFEFVDNL